MTAKLLKYIRWTNLIILGGPVLIIVSIIVFILVNLFHYVEWVFGEYTHYEVYEIIGNGWKSYYKRF
jgi:hypothetical protein